MTKEKDLGADAAAVGSAGSIASESATARHTKLPWRVVKSFSDERVICDAHTNEIALIYCTDGADEPKSLPAPATAAFIVLAVNCHADLYAALKALRNESHAILAVSYDAIKDSAGYTNLSCFLDRVKQAEAALAKAEGRTL
jgi:hypothetical protein